MNEDAGVTYMKSWQPGDTVLGLGGVGRVVKSNSPDFSSGDLVQAPMNWPWVEVFKSKTKDSYFELQKVFTKISVFFM